MRAASGTNAPSLNVFKSEWTTLRAHQHNVLLEGHSAATTEALRLLQPHVRLPTFWHHAPKPFDLPSGQAGALILKDVDALSADDQTRLLAWMGDTGSRTQIVSTTKCHLFTLVASGRFDEVLYYRLNVIRLPIGLPHSPELQVDVAERPGVERPPQVPALSV